MGGGGGGSTNLLLCRYALELLRSTDCLLVLCLACTKHLAQPGPTIVTGAIFCLLS